MLACSVCLGGAIEFVDHTYAGGSNDGETATPWTTIEDGTDDVSEGGEVRLRNAAYATTQISSDGYIIINAADGNTGKNFTIAVDSAVISATTITFATARAVRIDEDNDGFTITLKNITFTPSGGTPDRWFSWDTPNIGGNLTFEDCVYTGTKNINTVATGSGVREMRLIRCVATSLDDADIFDLDEFDLVYIDGCTFVNVFSTADQFFDIDATNNKRMVLIIKNSSFSLETELIKPVDGCNIETFVFDNNTVTWTDVIGAGGTIDGIAFINSTIAGTDNRVEEIRITNNTFQVDDATKYVQGVIDIRIGSDISAVFPIYGPLIMNNTFNADKANYFGTAIFIHDGVIGASVQGNYIVGFEDGVWDEGTYTDIQHNYAKCTNPLRLAGSVGGNVINNTAIAVDGQATGRALVLGRFNFSAESTDGVGDTFTATTYIDDTAWDLSTVVADGSMIAVVVADADAGGLDFTYAGQIVLVNDGTDTITVKEWIKFDGTIETPTVADFAVRCIRYPSKMRIYNNILDGTLSSFTFTFDYVPFDVANYIDYNCLQIGTSFMSNIGLFGNKGGATTNTLAAMQAVWLTYSAAYPLNGANSIELPPLVDSFGRLRTNSPCINAGRRDVDVNGNVIGRTSIGAWGPFALPSATRRPRYQFKTIYD